MKSALPSLAVLADSLRTTAERIVSWEFSESLFRVYTFEFLKFSNILNLIVKTKKLNKFDENQMENKKSLWGGRRNWLEILKSQKTNTQRGFLRHNLQSFGGGPKQIGQNGGTTSHVSTQYCGLSV